MNGDKLYLVTLPKDSTDFVIRVTEHGKVSDLGTMQDHSELLWRSVEEVKIWADKKGGWVDEL